MSAFTPEQEARIREIIARSGGPAALGRLIGIEPNTVKAWVRLNSIPATHWQAIAAFGAATLDELAEAAASRRPAMAKQPKSKVA